MKSYIWSTFRRIALSAASASSSLVQLRAPCRPSTSLYRASVNLPARRRRSTSARTALAKPSIMSAASINVAKRSSDASGNLASAASRLGRMFGFLTVKQAAIWFCAPSSISGWKVIAAGFTSKACARSFSACGISTLMKPLSRSVKVSVISCSVKSVRSLQVADALQNRHCLSPGTASSSSGASRM
ncbi:hypothetical protein D3C76_935470 [compost metagenome]